MITKKKITTFKSAKQEAEQVMESDRASKSLIEQVLKLLGDKRVQREIGKFFDNLKILFEMFKAYLKGVYKEIPWQTITMIVAALVYFVSPIDVIPDFILGVGYADDAVVITFVFKSVNDDIQNFLQWKESKASEPGSVKN